MSRLKTYIDDDLILESINDKGILHACFMAGMSGSGKTYTIKKISDGTIDPRIVNTDKMTEFLKAFNYDKWFDVADTIKKTTKNQLVLYLNSMLPLWCDGTSAKPNAVMRRNGILKSIGYDTALIWIDTSLETAIERSNKRKEDGGRDVPEDQVIKMHKQLQGLKKYYSTEFNNFTEILNDEGELIDKVIIQAYKKMSKFYNSSLKNPIGKHLIKNMEKNGHKYLIDTDDYDMAYLKKLVSNWYRK
jgi:predicted ABC-type ATPase